MAESRELTGLLTRWSAGDRTDLVHEAFLRLDGYERISWQDRAHLFAVASRVMRRVLVDRARRRKAVKRGGGAEKPDAVGAAPPARPAT